MALEPNFAASHRTSHRPENPQDHTDDHQDAADRLQNRQAGKVSDHRENDAQNYHIVLPSIERLPSWSAKLEYPTADSSIETSGHAGSYTAQGPPVAGAAAVIEIISESEKPAAVGG